MYKRRYPRRTALKRVTRGDRNVAKMNKKAKVANVVTVARQVSRLKKQIYRDTEMKRWSPTTLIASAVGQVNGNSTGAYFADLEILNTGESVGQDDRVGVEVNLKGIHLRFQMQQQNNAVSSNKFIIEVWKTADFGGTMNSIRDSIFAPDSISGVVDINSTKNAEYMKIYKRIASKSVYIGADQTTSHLVVKDFKMFIKQRQLLSYAGASATVPQNVRYFISIRACNGNISTGTASTLSTVPITGVLTGAVVRYQTTAYYTDN